MAAGHHLLPRIIIEDPSHVMPRTLTGPTDVHVAEVHGSGSAEVIADVCPRLVCTDPACRLSDAVD